MPHDSGARSCVLLTFGAKNILHSRSCILLNYFSGHPISILSGDISLIRNRYDRNVVMNILQTLLSHPILGPVLPVVWAALCMTVLLAYSGLAFMVGTLEVTGVRTKRSAYQKAARQLAVLCLALGWILLICSRIYLFVSSESYVPSSLLATVTELSWGAFGFSVIAVSVHFAVWNFFEKHRIWHALLIFLAGINALASIYAILGSLRLIAALELPNAALLTLADLFNFTFPSPMYNAIFVTLPLTIAMPAAVALVWLAIRRKRDDFGRDYYTTIMKWVARWGFMAWIPVVLVAGVFVYFEVVPLLDAESEITAMTVATQLAHFLPALLLAISMGCISKSDLPMRYKALALLSLFLSMPCAYFAFEDATSFVF